MEPATLPGLQHLSLGAPTAGGKKAQRKVAESKWKAAAQEVAEANHRAAFIKEMADNNRAAYKRMLDECKRLWEVDTLTEEDHILDFVTSIVQHFFEIFVTARWAYRDDREAYDQLWKDHHALLKRIEHGADVHSLPHDPPTDVVEFDSMLLSHFATFALYLLENYVQRTYPYAATETKVDAGTLKGPRSAARTPEEIDRIINTPDVEVLISGVALTLQMQGFPEDYDELIGQVDSYLSRLGKYTDREWRASGAQGGTEAAPRTRTRGGARELAKNDKLDEWKERARARLKQEADARLQASQAHHEHMLQQRADQEANKQNEATMRHDQLARERAGSSAEHARALTALERAQQAEHKRQADEEKHARLREVARKVRAQKAARRKVALEQEARLEERLKKLASGIAIGEGKD